MSDNDSFDQSFMQNVQNQVASDSVAQRERSSRKKGLIIGAAIGLIVIAIVVFVIVMQKMNAQTEEVYDDSTDKGTAREYGDDDENDENMVAIRMNCLDKDKNYSFYKDNTYEIMSLSTDETIETGSYTIGGSGKNFTLEANGTNRTITYDGTVIIDGEFRYACEEYENV